MRHDFVHTISKPLAHLDIAALDQEMVQTAEKGIQILSSAQIDLSEVDVVFELDMSYIGQTHTVSVPLPVVFQKEGTGIDIGLIQRAFEERYKQNFGQLLSGIETRVLSLRTAVIGRRPKFDLSTLTPSGENRVETAFQGHRDVWHNGAWCSAEIYHRLALPIGACINGPAILEQPDTTIYIDPDLCGTVDDFGNLILARKEEG
jgi:N-methylhydantoinase A